MVVVVVVVVTSYCKLHRQTESHIETQTYRNRYIRPGM